MRADYDTEDDGDIEYERIVDRKKNLSLENVMVLRIGPKDKYMISIYGLKKWDCNDRIILSSTQNEIQILRDCLRDNLELERKSVLNYMQSEKIEMYNEALNAGKYDICAIMLINLEYDLNEMSKKRNKELLKRRED